MFTAVAELLGEAGCVHPRGQKDMVELGHAKLLFIEAAPNTKLDEICELSQRFSWKDLFFVKNITHHEDFDPSAGFSYSVVQEALCGEECLKELLPNPPFQLGWFRKSASCLTREIENLGSYTTCRPIQYMLSASSAIVAVDSSDGSFFLKGVCPGSRELEITADVTRIFPKHTASLVATNEELRAFITREFDRCDETSRGTILETLFDIQSESSVKGRGLIAGGVLRRVRPVDIEGIVKGWESDPNFIEAVGANISGFKRIVPGLIQMAQDLAEYNLPMCLVHGDFSKRNMGVKEAEDGSGTQHLIFHDWQFAVVGHPFYEFHDTSEGWDEEINEYLKKWDGFENLTRCQEAYELAKVLGWLPKVIGTLECIRQGDIVARFGASLTRGFLLHVLLYFERQVDYRREAGLLIC